MQFLTPGEKVKKIRKYLKISQRDLQDEYISRGLVSMVEIGKRELTNNVALRLAEKFKQKAKELNVKLELDKDYIMRSPSEDAEIYCLKKLEECNSIDNINEIYEIACQYDLTKIKAMFFTKKADLNLIKKQYSEAFINYNKAIIIYQNIKQYEMLPSLYCKIGYSKAEVAQYKDALAYFDISQFYLTLYKDIKVQQKVLYDAALCYKKINKYDIALEYINNFLFCYKDKDYIYYYANILKANCYEDTGQYDIAIEIYNCLYKELSNHNNSLLGYICNNLAIAYLKKSEFDKSLEYFNKSEVIRKSVDEKYLDHSLIEKSEVYIRKHNYAKAIKLIEQGLKYADSYNDYEYLLKGNYKLIQIYESINDNIKVKETYLVIIEILNQQNNFIELNSVYIKLSLIYLNENDIKNAKYYLSLSQKLKI